jgi:thioredoxin 1
MLVELTKENFEDIVLKSDRPVMLDFYAQWCGPCKNLIPTLENLASQYEDKVIVAKVNVDNERDITTNFGVMNLPTVLVMNNHQIVEKIIGLQSKETYQKSLDNMLIY